MGKFLSWTPEIAQPFFPGLYFLFSLSFKETVNVKLFRHIPSFHF